MKAIDFYNANATNIVDVPRPGHPEDPSGIAGVWQATKAGIWAEDAPVMSLDQACQFAEAYARAALSRGPQWIPVSEKLPDNFEQVLAYLKPVDYPRSNYTLAWSKRGIWFGLFDNDFSGNAKTGEIPDGYITHWMPLPAAPPLPQPERKENE